MSRKLLPLELLVEYLHKIIDRLNLETLKIRNLIVSEVVIPSLKENGFSKTPFKSGLYGKNNLNDYTYTMCRIVEKNELQLIIIHVSKEDLWIKIFLNIFKLSPNINSIIDLTTSDGINFHLSPNNKNEMRLKIDGYKFPPILRDLFYQQYKLSNSIFTYHKFNVMKLRNVLEKDMNNIDLFISKWHKLYSPSFTDWEGNSIE